MNDYKNTAVRRRTYYLYLYTRRSTDCVYRPKILYKLLLFRFSTRRRRRRYDPVTTLLHGHVKPIKKKVKKSSEKLSIGV